MNNNIRLIYWLTTESDCGTETQLFSTETAMLAAVKNLINDAWHDVVHCYTAPDLWMLYDKLADQHPRDFYMWWGEQALSL